MTKSDDHALTPLQKVIINLVREHSHQFYRSELAKLLSLSLLIKRL